MNKTLAINPDWIKQFREQKAALAKAKEEIANAREKLREAEDRERKIKDAQYNSEQRLFKNMIQRWLQTQLAGKTLREQQEFADTLSAKLAECAKNGNDISHVSIDITNDVYAANKDFFDEFYPEASFLRPKGHVDWNIRQVFKDAIADVFAMICPIWRAEPSIRSTYERKAELNRLGHHTTPRLVTRNVFRVLLNTKRIKHNQATWERATGCDYSFRNKNTIDADIGKAIDEASALREATQAYTWAA